MSRLTVFAAVFAAVLALSSTAVCSTAALAQSVPRSAAPEAVVRQAAAPAAADPIPRTARAEARRDCYAENIALAGTDLRQAMRDCMQARFPGVKLYGSDGLTRDGRPTAATARTQCRQEADQRGLAGQERRQALVSCFGAKRPDLAQRAECRKEARGKGLAGEALRAAIAACARSEPG